MSAAWDKSGPLTAAEFAPDFPDDIVIVCRAPHVRSDWAPKGVEFLLTIPRAKFEAMAAAGKLPLQVQALELDAVVTLRGAA